MPRITLLEEDVINKIAAGEVIERPSFVVKELVENAIDAQAGVITVELKEGGFSLIRVTDNGCGMEKEDVKNAFLRHATSKITQIEDLQTMESLGFRGEALASIAAVSQTEMITKTAGALLGTRYLIYGGKEQGVEAVGCPEGTTFLIRNLFFNTPARKKFMKTPQTEAGYTGDIMQYLALSHPSISFKFISNGQVKMQTSGNGNRKEVIYSIFGRDIASNLCNVEEWQKIGEDVLHFSGFCGKPVISRGNRNLEMYFINGRYMKSNVINQAIEDAYKPYLMMRKYPFTALYLEIPKHLVDINVHPSKMEARFSNREAIYQLVQKAVSKALQCRELIPKVTVQKETFKKKPVTVPMMRPAEPFEQKRLLEEKKEQQKTMEEAVMFMEKPTDYKTPVKQTELFEIPLLSMEARKQHRIIGQLFSTYWLVEFGENLFIIDQHAAHEKVLYERNLKAFRERKEIYSQMIAPPVVVSLSMTEQEAWKEHSALLKQMGFDLEPFGGNEYALYAVPADMMDIADHELFLEFLDVFIKGKKTPEFILEKLAMISCKGAVKGKNKLQREELETLIDELLTLENPYHCPHGRPTIISMSRYEIEKKFKRII